MATFMADFFIAAGEGSGALHLDPTDREMIVANLASVILAIVVTTWDRAISTTCNPMKRKN